jgi:hypothetical protein
MLDTAQELLTLFFNEHEKGGAYQRFLDEVHAEFGKLTEHFKLFAKNHHDLKTAELHKLFRVDPDALKEAKVLYEWDFKPIMDELIKIHAGRQVAVIREYTDMLLGITEKKPS